MRKMRNLFKAAVCMAFLTLTFNCSNDDNEPVEVFERSFTTNTDTDFFINADGTINLIVTGAFQDTTPTSNVASRGFVYGTSSNTEVSDANTVGAIGPQNSVTGNIQNLENDQTYYIRGYFEMSDGSYFYGNEIEASTDVDASSTRSIVLGMEPNPFFVSTTELTPQVNVTEVTKESPTEIWFEYSQNNDLSNSTTVMVTGILGNVLVTGYQEVVSGLTSGTTYYFKSYVKYADGTTTDGGATIVAYTTN